MRFFKFLFPFFLLLSSFTHSETLSGWYVLGSQNPTYFQGNEQQACNHFFKTINIEYKVAQQAYACWHQDNTKILGYVKLGQYTPLKCPSATSVDLKVPTSSGSYVCTQGCQYKLKACVDVDFESGMTCTSISTGQECGQPKPTDPNPTTPVTQDPTNPTDKTEDQAIFENIMNVIGDKLDSIKDAINGGNQNQDGGDTGGSNGGTTGSDVNVNVDMSETNAKIDETNSLIDDLTKWLQGEDLGDDIFGDSEPPEKELTPEQFDTNIFSGSAQCPADARLNFKLLGGKSFTKTFEFKDWCDNLEIFGSFILIASYLFGAYIIVSKS